MKCLICKEGEYAPGFVTVVLTQKECTLIIKAVPAEVCKQCGEYTLDSATAKIVYAMVEDAFSNGTEIEIRRFVA
jgi:YgiT-type zinc finger domain-containing protein